MSSTEGGPNIVTNGLVFYVDAANPKSYVSGSTAWNDISKNNNNGTLINGPTFDSANGGSIVFDGVDDYANFGNPTSLQITGAITLSAWVKTSMSGTGFVLSKDNLSKRNFALVVVEVSGTLRARFFIVKSNTLVNVTSITIDVGDNNWHYIVGINDGNDIKIYVDGNLEATNTGVGGIIDNDAVDFEIGRRGDNNQFYNGKIANAQTYNLALSDLEVLQNYNATKTRFGL